MGKHQRLKVVRPSVGLMWTVAEEIIHTLVPTGVKSDGLILSLPWCTPTPLAWGKQKKVMVELQPKAW